ncbi:ABC transporter permease [Nakamurella silvestris]|nr:ABC transporter permease [Nakamurella silvestris]
MSAPTVDKPAGLPTPPPKPKGRILAPAISGQEYVLVGVIAALWVILGFATPRFLSSGSIQPLLANVAPIALIGVGMTLIIITAGIDVSVGAMVMVCSVITAKMMVAYNIPLVLSIVIAMVTGGVLGLINGLLIAYGRVQAIIITFGTANLFQFLGLQIFGSETVNNLPDSRAFFGAGPAGRTFGLPHAFFLTLIIAAVAWYYLRHTAGGRHFYAIGGDPQAARLAGVRVQRRTLIAYVVTGLLVGLGACFTIALGTATVQANIGDGKELAVIAAVVIGGTSIMGGRGSVLGTVLGALLVQTVTSGVTQLGWPTQLSDLFVGIAIVIAVGVDLVRERARRKK